MIVGKRILVLSPFQNWPLVNGAVTRIYHLTRYLSNQNDVYFFFRDSERYTEPDFSCHAIPGAKNRFLQLFDPRLLISLLNLIRQADVDLIISTHLWSSLNGVLLKVLSKRLFLFDDHNVEYLRFQRVGSPLWPLVRLLEWLVCRMADRVICVSENDRTHLINHLHTPTDRIQVVENGADVNGLQARLVDTGAVRYHLGVASDELMLLFFGSLEYAPNQEAVGIILDQIVPRLVRQSCRFKIIIAGVGREAFRATPEIPANVIFAGFVDDLVALIKSADLIIVPLLAGSGTRFKIIESVACGRRVLTTSVGVEGLDRDILGDFVMVCDEWDLFAQQILATPPGFAPRLPGRDFIARYDWEGILRNLNL